MFNGGIIEDARTYGDGYDFQINFNDNFLLVEVKGIRKKHGQFRLTQKEYERANEYENQYILTVIFNLIDSPKIGVIKNPIKNFQFEKVERKPKTIIEYQLLSMVSITDFNKVVNNN